MKKRYALMAGTAMMAAFMLTGCGKADIDLAEYVKIEANGYDGYGRGNVVINWNDMVEDNYKAFGLKDTDDEEDKAFQRAVDKLEKYVELDYVLPATLANGDNITVEVEIDEKLMKEFKVNFTNEESFELTVSGLEKVASFDAFEGLNVVFDGYAPTGTARIDDSMLATGVSGLNYTLDKYDGLSVGDVVTCTITSYYGDDVYTYCAENYQKVPETLTKEFTVDGLCSYATSLSEIPQDIMNQMKSQTEDNIEAYIAKESDSYRTYSVSSKNLLGSYFLTSKDMNNYSSGKTMLYLVYSVNVASTYQYNKNQTYTANKSFLYVTRFNDIVVMADGTGSCDVANGSRVGDSIYLEFENDKTWGTYVNGYTDAATLKNKVVTSQLDRYNFEDGLNTSSTPAAAEEGTED